MDNPEKLATYIPENL